MLLSKPISECRSYALINLNYANKKKIISNDNYSLIKKNLKSEKNLYKLS
jgi:hypothetical protein